MHKINYVPAPYSFARDRQFIQLINNQKLSNQLQTNQQSDNSELIDIHFNKESMRTDISYESLIKSMREQVEYHKEALKTAQSLISNYQKQNHTLKQQNIKITDQLKKVNMKLENVQRLLFKLFQSQKSDLNSPSKKYIASIPSSSLQIQQLETFRTLGKQQEDDQQLSLYKRIQKFYQRQMLYQEQILSLNNKIRLLQKSAYSDIKNIHKNKLKNSIYVPFTCNEAISDQKMKMANKLIQIYGAQEKSLAKFNTNKSNLNKHSQFKKNLQKQFELFLQKSKTTTKTKTSISRIPLEMNSKSTHSISVSGEKKNTGKRSSSIPKK